MTPEEFKERMEEIKKEHGDCHETGHQMADSLITDLLEELGYEEGVEIFWTLKLHYS